MRILLICTLALLSGCARGPTLSEAADRLEHDSRSVIDAGARRLGTPGARPKVLFNASRQCGDGKARQVWRGTVPLRHGPDPRAALDNATDVSIGLVRAHGYRLESPPAIEHRLRTFAMAHDGSDVRIVVRLRGGHHPAMQLDASTLCLPRT